jgi:hypothetical protein
MLFRQSYFEREEQNHNRCQLYTREAADAEATSFTRCALGVNKTLAMGVDHTCFEREGGGNVAFVCAIFREEETET